MCVMSQRTTGSLIINICNVPKDNRESSMCNVPKDNRQSGMCNVPKDNKQSSDV